MLPRFCQYKYHAYDILKRVTKGSDKEKDTYTHIYYIYIKRERRIFNEANPLHPQIFSRIILLRSKLSRKDYRELRRVYRGEQSFALNITYELSNHTKFSIKYISPQFRTTTSHLMIMAELVPKYSLYVINREDTRPSSFYTCISKRIINKGFLTPIPIAFSHSYFSNIKETAATQSWCYRNTPGST
jgi:hypothetical protein